MMEANRDQRPPNKTRHERRSRGDDGKGERKALDRDGAALRGWIDLALGLALFAIGAIVYAATHGDLSSSSVTYFATYVPMVAGGMTAVRGIWRLARSPVFGAVPLRRDFGLGYKSFVAWRYLLVHDPKVTARTKRLVAIGIASAVAAGALRWTRVVDQSPGLDNPFWVAWIAALVFVGVVIIWGVLRFSKPALVICLFGLGVLGLALLGGKVVGLGKLPFLHLDPETTDSVLRTTNITWIGGAFVAAVAMFFGSLRAYFTFFTTVPIGGVWIGTAALVMVLSVMSGFESDLRDKILGSNAHLQITRDDGEFTEWRDVKARIDRMPGVIASSPYATSEVVIAANNTGMNVIIKGIDPDNIGTVTDLVSDLEDREAMKRLAPLIDDSRDLTVPQTPRTEGDVIDPPPADMPGSGEPIDFSEGGAGSGSGTSDDGPVTHPDPPLDSRSDSRSDTPSDTRHGGTQVEPPAPFGGDAGKLLGDLEPRDLVAHEDLAAYAHRIARGSAADRAAAPTVDPPPADLIINDEPPDDYSRPDYAPESVVKVIDVPFDTPSLSRRTQALPGILVGRELVKQTHMYTGQEVRVVSPLSDPANPDATGTPIPFNRDFRVAGIFFTGMYEYDLKYVYVTLDALQTFLDRGDAIDGIEVRVDHPDDTDAFIAQFHAAFGPHYRVVDWKELNRSLFSALKLEKIAMFLVLGIVILVASFSIVGDLIMVVVEKAREIALLKTLGASDIGVMQLFAIQGLMIGVIGTVLGIATGLGGCWAGKRFGLPLNPDVYYIDRLPIHVDPASVVAAASAGILISIAATLYPALVAARVRPAAGMRH
jgi:lipoprotein-releasing system permease protein